MEFNVTSTNTKIHQPRTIGIQADRIHLELSVKSERHHVFCLRWFSSLLLIPQWELEVSRTLPYFPFRIIWQVRLWCLGSGQIHCLSLLLLDAVQHIMEDGPTHPILIKIGKKPAIPLCTGIYSPCSNNTHIFKKKKKTKSYIITSTVPKSLEF